MSTTKKHEGITMRVESYEYLYPELGWLPVILADQKPTQSRLIKNAQHTEYFCEAYIAEDKRLRLKYRPGNNKKISLPANLKLTYVDNVLVSAEVL
jgi:hypothetical protein